MLPSSSDRGGGYRDRSGNIHVIVDGDAIPFEALHPGDDVVGIIAADGVEHAVKRACFGRQPRVREIFQVEPDRHRQQGELDESRCPHGREPTTCR